MAKIMLVDDDLGVVRILEKYLTKIGHTIVGTTSTGEAAIEMARSLEPDLAIMDIVLAGEIDGIDAAGLLKGDLGVPSIYITGHADNEEYIERAPYTEPYGFISKPFELDEVRVNVEIALYRASLDRSS